MTALTPTRPTFLRSPVPEMPSTTTQKTSGAMTILISLMKPSPRGFSITAKSGTKTPRTTPKTNASMTWPKSDLKRLGIA
jgi:hypothetical protein